MKTYNWQKSDWTHFQYDLNSIHETLLSIAEKSGLIRGKLTHLDENLQTEALITLMVEEAGDIPPLNATRYSVSFLRPGK